MLSHDYSRLVLVVKYMNHKESNQDEVRTPSGHDLCVLSLCAVTCLALMIKRFQGNFVSSSRRNAVVSPVLSMCCQSNIVHVISA